MDYNDYGYGSMLAFWLLLAPILLIFAIAGYVIGSFFLMRVFEKAGVQGKWRAWVPVYNSLVAAKLGDLSPWVMLGAIVAAALLGQIPVIGWLLSLLGVAAWVLSGWRIGRKLGKDWPYLLLWLIPGVGTLIWIGILAFDKATWNPNISRAPWANSFLKDTTVWTGIPVQPGAPAAAGGAYPPPAPGAYPPAAPGTQPPAGYSAPPAGYAPPPAGYTPPPAAAEPPAGYAPPPAAAEPPAGYSPPPPAGYTPPPASPEPPAGYTPPPASAPEPPAGYTPPPAASAPEPPAAPAAPEAPLPPAAPEPPTAPEAPVIPEPPVEPAPPVAPEPAPPVTPEPPVPGEPEPPIAPKV
jgi:hypothetical protein